MITLSGLPGSGTSTVARMLAQTLVIERVDGGSLYRAMAKEHGMSLAEFGEFSESNEHVDRDLDDRLLVRARLGDVLLESRMAGWLVYRAALPSTRIWLSCDAEVRAERVASRDGASVANAKRDNAKREASEQRRYHDFYNVDLRSMDPYSHVMDSSVLLPEQIVQQIVGSLVREGST